MKKYLYEWAQNDRLLDLLYANKSRVLVPEEALELEELLLEEDAKKVVAIFNIEETEPEAPYNNEDAAVLGLDFLEKYKDNDNAWQEFEQWRAGRSGEAVVKKMPVRRIQWAAAAILAALVCTGLYFLMGNKGSQQQQATAHDSAQPVIRPGGNKALLILGDGRQLVLDHANKGELARQGSTTINILDKGQLAFTNHLKLGEANPTANTTNKLLVPAGGQYKLDLPDGSKVWINAASSLRFPSQFTGKTREVELEGEAYFEIAKNASMPFHVKVSKMDVEVLGTHFNINSYIDEPYAITTLEEGVVRVHVNNKVQTLLPGQQSLSNEAGKLVVQPADLTTALAWKNGRMYFNDADIPTIMRQVARWYNIKIRYTGAVTVDPFTGGISRSADLEVLLNILKTSGIKFRVEEDPEGKTLVVTP